MGLYHYTLGFPRGFSSKVGRVNLKYGRHALEASQNDRYGAVKLPLNIDTNAAACIETEIDQGQVLKLVYRVPYNAGLDLVLVVIPRGSEFFVKTVWLNQKTDKHLTLDVSKYEKVA